MKRHIPLKLKVCGMRDALNIKAVAALKPDFMGFIFYDQSPRFVGEQFDPALLQELPDEIAKVGVFVNEEFGEVLGKVKRYKLNYVQLHGSESPDYCSRMADHVKVIRTFGIGKATEFEEVETYASFCSYLLFDTKTKDHGGSGRKFDWNLLQRYKGNTPFFISGGIDLASVNALLDMQSSSPALSAIDVNSRFETLPGLKDLQLLKQLKQNLR
jgi:phosphoribosylanthranilate isomerase